MKHSLAVDRANDYIRGCVFCTYVVAWGLAPCMPVCVCYLTTEASSLSGKRMLILQFQHVCIWGLVEDPEICLTDFTNKTYT